MRLIESISGIRGIYNNTLNQDVARRYAYIYNEFLLKRCKKPTVVIGRDTRDSGEAIHKAVTGVFYKVIDLGIATTPMTELAVREYNADGGIIITASHNEPEWNGMKFLDNDGAVLKHKDMTEIICNYNSLRNGFVPDDSNTEIVYMHEDIILRYVNFVSGIIGKDNLKTIKNSGIKFIIDPNGGAGILSGNVLKGLGIKFKAVNEQAGVFKRMIEPNEDSLAYLRGMLKRYGCELAFGFDCDADRVGFVHSNGIVSGHYLLALIVDDLLSDSKSPEQEVVVVNDATSGIVQLVAERHNSRLVETDVGESNVVESMKKYNSIVGGEGSSSGVIFRGSKCRDGILTMLAVLKILAQKKSKIMDILRQYPTFTTLQRTVTINTNSVPKIKARLSSYYRRLGYEVKIGESIKAITDNGSFVWFRVSKTENNKMRIVSDSEYKEIAVQLMSEALDILNSSI